MKLRLFAHSLIFVCICSSFISIHEELHQAMTKMMEKMKSMKMSGNADHDFAMMMAEHHQGSIDMSEIVLKSGKDEKIKSLATSIHDKQRSEQQQLRSHSPKDDSQHAAHNTDKTSSYNTFSSQMKGAISEMESSMKSMKMTNDVDHDFATMMIPHHQSAIDMSEAILKYGTDGEMKNIAEKIKSDSEKEMNELKAWLKDHNK